MRKKTKRWSSQVTRHSNALDLEKGVFTKRDPQAIARSLKASAEHSTRRKTTPFQSAMSMLNFYINRMGSSMPRSRRVVLERAKDRLRQLFRRPRSPS
jgi:G:T/U-mismatch repair DNA glycosylase